MNTTRNGGEKAREAARAFAELGLSACLTARGIEGEVAVVTAAAAEHDKLCGAVGLELVQRLKGLGFRYVALDLAPGQRER